MFIEVAWILVTAATVSGSSSTSCQSDTIVNVCSLDPDMGDGERTALDYFYDWRTDKCISMYFGFSGKEYGEENRFFNEEQCNSKCRNVKSECFEEPVNVGGKGDIEKWKYNDASSKCVPFRWKQGRRKDTNTFGSLKDCIERCRKPDLGLCAYKFQTECKHGDDLYIWYDNATQECKILPPHHLSLHMETHFYTFRQVLTNGCGRFEKK
uniref:Putative salivary kunitz domain protein n=1 Tax=Ixodes ricinus TaxID=34613 RepID=A0A0K8RKT8_IXORI